MKVHIWRLFSTLWSCICRKVMFRQCSPLEIFWWVCGALYTKKSILNCLPSSLTFYLKYSCIFNIQLISSNFTLFLTTNMMSLILREERKLREVENMVLRRIFGPRRHKVTAEWRRLHNKELNDLYSPNIVRVIKSRRMRWAGNVARMGEERGV